MARATARTTRPWLIARYTVPRTSGPFGGGPPRSRAPDTSSGDPEGTPPSVAGAGVALPPPRGTTGAAMTNIPLRSGLAQIRASSPGASRPVFRGGAYGWPVLSSQPACSTVASANASTVPAGLTIVTDKTPSFCTPSSGRSCPRRWA